jgi:hypothetical protein
MKPLSRFPALLTIVVAFLAMLIRVRILMGTPLPPSHTVPWLLSGLAGDLLVCVPVAFAVAFLFSRAPRAGSFVLIVLMGFDLVLQFAVSEAVVFLGHSVRGDDLETGLHPLLLTGSAAGGVAGSFVLLLVLFGAGATWAFRWRERTSITLLRLAVVTLLLSLSVWIASPIDRADIGQNAMLSLPAMLRNARVEQPPAKIPPPTLDLLLARELIGRKPGTFLSDAYPLARIPPTRDPHAPVLTPGPKPNIVFIVMESLRAEEVGAYGDDPPGLTPNLDRLAREGIRVDNAYSAGGYTPEGELGVLYGALASPFEIVIRSHPTVHLHGFPEVLSASGWKSLLWIHGSDATVYLGGRFYRAHGIPTIDGRDFPTSDSSTSWGYSDRALMRHAIDALDHMPQPFASMVLTITNHHPFQLPDDAPAGNVGLHALFGQMLGRHTASMLRTVHYTDAAVGELLAKARNKPWFANTIFVVCGDHGIDVPPVNRKMTRHVFFELRHHIPLIIYSPRLPGGLVVHGPASQTDILPTILGLTGVEVPLAATGRDLLDGASSDDERPIISWDLEGRTVTVNRGQYSYHAVVPSGTTTTTDELLVDRERDPNGLRNLASSEPATTAACRRAASIYLRTFGWLIANDRLTLPGTVPLSGLPLRPR